MTDADRELCERITSTNIKAALARGNLDGWCKRLRAKIEALSAALHIATNDKLSFLGQIEALSAEVAALKQQKLFDQDYYGRSQTWAAKLTEAEHIAQGLSADLTAEGQKRDAAEAKLAEAERERNQYRAQLELHAYALSKATIR